ncbi:MAG: A/G-specific adenine glycosylase [Clostridiales bacterium]|nr:MAG: A/G-specific adenine glycosylase [Clostridiales bacterium]
MIKKFTKKEKEQLAKQVIVYYDKQSRSLPWRDNPTPYYVWVSEIMLQQTRVKTVIDYFNRFIAAFPTIADLAEANEDILLKQWEGLGYYSRARNLQKAAKIIVEKWEGCLPQEKDDLITLPGIGDYTAGAISSIAYGKDEVAVDGNFIRVASRLLAFNGNVWNAEGKHLISDFWKSVLPKNQASAFNQGVMDIGATICLPNGEPHCKCCPISKYCQSFQQGNPLHYPVKKRKKKRTIQKKTVLLLYWNNQVMIRKRPKKGLLGGLLEFPMIDGYVNKDEVITWLKKRGYEVIRIKKGEQSKHIFSHIEWHMTSWEVEVNSFTVSERIDNAEQWVERGRISEITLPTAFKVFRKRVECGK